MTVPPWLALLLLLIGWLSGMLMGAVLLVS
jgi:hypothetical protein